MREWIKHNILYVSFLQALVATTSSLFFSEILHFTPCVLCWYQRICMYPLVIILAIGILKKDKLTSLYVLPLSLIGLVVSIYQNLLVFGIIPEAISPCSIGVSCTTKYFEYFGFITIPFLSLLSFVVIITCMLLYKRYNTK